jgi:hypothetical protein
VKFIIDLLLLLSFGEFHENWPGEGGTLLAGINENTFTCVL